MNKNIACDLDGTLIATNSFPLWIKFLIIKCITTCNVTVMARIINALFSRKILKKPHSAFKEKLQAIAQHERWNLEFALSMKPLLNPAVYSAIIEAKKAGHNVILATAAPCNYAEPFAREVLNVQLPVLSSGWYNGNYINNTGEIKAIRCRDYFNRYPEVFYTDHHEDIPLIIKSGISYIVNPSGHTQSILSRTAANWEIFHEARESA